MKKQRTSFSIQNVGDEQKLVDFFKLLQPTTVGVMDNPALLKRLVNEVPSIEVAWFRPYREDDGAFWNKGQEPRDWLLKKWNEAGLQGVRGAHLSVMCEPVFIDPESTRIAVQWMVETMAFFKARGIPTVMLNAQPAVFPISLVEAGLFDPLLEALSDGYHKLGWHEYAGVIPAKGTNGGDKADMLDPAKCQPKDWPTFDQVRNQQNEDNWLIGRLYWWDDRAKTMGYNVPLKVISEIGQDDMPVYADEKWYFIDVYGFPKPHWTLRGWNTLRFIYEAYYKDTFPAPVFENAQIAVMKWWDSIYDESVIGVNYFIWSPNKFDWDIQYGFDFSKNTVLHQKLIEWTNELRSDLVDQKVLIKPKSGSANFRATPNGARLATINAEVEALKYGVATVTLAGYTWQKYRIENVDGWVALQVIDERPAPVDTEPETIAISRAELTDMRRLFMNAVELLDLYLNKE